MNRHGSCFPLTGERGAYPMLKRFTICLAGCLSSMLAFASSANATPEAAEDWGARAGSLYTITAQLLSSADTAHNTDLEAEYIEGLTQFSTIAGRLTVWVDTTGGASDFGCIYRGMAEEAETQLIALETAHTTADAKAALTRIATLLDDAQSIAVTSAHAVRTGTTTATTSHCPASALPLDSYLTGRGS